ncbi:c-type cytochrome [Neobacillus drentensis]|uniref:c-type cytochrome n=1 Tax=Neobacillus drentensis TaxID=220684 RepID=UPI002FFE82D3
MKRILGVSLLIFMMAALSACSNDDPSKEPASTPTSETTKELASEPATASAGGDIFQKSCITCHSSGDITGGQVKLDSTKIHAVFQQKEELYSFVSKNMPKSAPGSLTKEQYDAVVNYLWDQK